MKPTHNLGIALLLLGDLGQTLAWLSLSFATSSRNWVSGSCMFLSFDEQPFDDNDDIEFRPEQSQMSGYVLDYLRRNANFENSTTDEDVAMSETSKDSTANDADAETSDQPHTHLVAIPMEDCHELLLELESVQRAILYHCPVLVHACIPQATTRLPLLLVTANRHINEVASTQQLHDMVQEVVQTTLLVAREEQNEENEEDSDEDKPILLRFQTLEMDGAQNEVLYTVGVEETALQLRALVERLRRRIHQEPGWTTELPPDNPQASSSESSDINDVFRPRVPFMRLPDNWNEILRRKYEGESENIPVDDENTMMLGTDEGGNGISPIFWYKWWEDDFGVARLRDVAIYKRSRHETISTDGCLLNERIFHLPYQSIPLPKGDEALTEHEAKFRAYQDERMKQAEAYLDQDPDSADDVNEPAQDDLMFSKTRQRLETLYESSPRKPPTPEVEEKETTAIDTVTTERPEDPSAMDDWMRQRIQNVVASRAKVKTDQTLAEPTKKPPIEDNEVFRKFKEGTLVPKQSDSKPKPKLPPFPSREHCAGFWRVVASPTGFMVEEGDATRSDNLILRVDGTTAGGPILDQETRQKASGGTWRLQGTTKDDASLLIRLVVPPEKERVLVMEGRLEKASLSSDFTLAGSSFGIPEIEALKSQSNSEMEDLLSCSGKVWMEDAVTKANRDDIGTFSLMKMEVSHDPDSYTITVPRPVRNQD